MIVAFLLLALAQAAPEATPPPVSSRFEKLPTPEEAEPLGSRISRSSDYVTAGERDAAWTMHRFAECLVRTREGQMIELLSSRLNSPEQMRIVRDVIGWRSRCLRARSMQIDHILLRGAVAEALYRQQLRGREVGVVERAPAMLEADPARSTAAALERFGRCMVARHPELVRPLIGTRPGSQQEEAALTAIEAALPACLPESPRRARHRLLLRGALAEAFYLHVHGLLGDTQRTAATATPAAERAPAAAEASD